MNALSNMGLLSRFVGMLTDSRSFLVVLAARVFPPAALQPAGQRRRTGSAAPNDGGSSVQLCRTSASATRAVLSVSDRLTRPKRVEC